MLRRSLRCRAGPTRFKKLEVVVSVHLMVCSRHAGWKVPRLDALRAVVWSLAGGVCGGGASEISLLFLLLALLHGPVARAECVGHHLLPRLSRGVHSEFVCIGRHSAHAHVDSCLVALQKPLYGCALIRSHFSSDCGPSHSCALVLSTSAMVEAMLSQVFIALEKVQLRRA